MKGNYIQGNYLYINLLQFLKHVRDCGVAPFRQLVVMGLGVSHEPDAPLGEAQQPIGISYIGVGRSDICNDLEILGYPFDNIYQILSFTTLQ